MTNMKVQLVFRRVLSLAGVLAMGTALLVAQQPPPPPDQQQPAQQMAPNQLDTLVAPIALYPDALLSQVLVAATYPLEIAEAAQWIDQHRDLQGSQLVDAARQQNWDPSIQALVVFPDVVSRLNSDIRWTTDLGNAFLAQQADVMNAVQRMRQQAMASGKLRSDQQQTVTTQVEDGQPEVEIQPANPEVVYVPYYDPAYIWGAPAYGYYPAWDYAGFGFGFYPGIYIGGFFGGLGWGGWGWGLSWHSCSVFQRPFFFNHYGFGGFHGGRAFAGGNVLWSHNPGHRMGIAYSNRSVAARYGGVSNGRGAFSNGRFGGQNYSPQRSNLGGRANTAQGGGWSRFGQSTRTYAPPSSSRSNPTYGGNSNYGAARTQPSYRSNPSYGGSNGYGAARTAPSYRSTSPNSGGGRTYGSNPSYSNGGGRSSAPSYRPTSPSYGGGRAAPSYRSSPSGGSGRSYGGGGAARSSGGGGGGGGGGSVRSSGGGGGGSHSGGGGGGGSHGGGSHR